MCSRWPSRGGGGCRRVKSVSEGEAAGRAGAASAHILDRNSSSGLFDFISRESVG